MKNNTVKKIIRLKAGEYLELDFLRVKHATKSEAKIDATKTRIRLNSKFERIGNYKVRRYGKIVATYISRKYAEHCEMPVLDKEGKAL